MIVEMYLIPKLLFNLKFTIIISPIGAMITLSLLHFVVSTDYMKENSRLALVPDDIPDDATRILLRGNKITTLRPLDFSNLTSCVILDVGENSIVKIEDGTFGSELSSLKDLYLDNNMLTKLRANMFIHLYKLQVLLVHYNQISTIEDNIFLSLTKLWQLHLAGNALTELRSSMFNGLKSIRLLNLDDNQLISIDSSTFSNLPRSLTLALGFNPLQCDRRLCWLKEEEERGQVKWLLWDGHLFKPDCVEGMNWTTWNCSEGKYI